MTSAIPSHLTVVADIGGTNTRVALADGGTVQSDSLRKYRNADFASFDKVLSAFLAEEGLPGCAGVCVAIAGPVRNGAGTLTNLDWRLEEAHLAEATGAPVVRIVNDLQAQGYGLAALDPANVRNVIAGPPAATGETQLVIGVGTGFNAAAVLHPRGGKTLVTPSEAGHANLPASTEQELRLCRYVETAHGFPAIEDVLSGRGLERAYGFLWAERGERRHLAAADIMAAVAEGQQDAQEALGLFVGLLGRVAGNLSLIHLPYGGVYLVGGVVRSVAPYFARMGFAEAYRNKGRFSTLMAEFSVSVVEDDFAALSGCAMVLENQLG